MAEHQSAVMLPSGLPRPSGEAAVGTKLQGEVGSGPSPRQGEFSSSEGGEGALLVSPACGSWRKRGPSHSVSGMRELHHPSFHQHSAGMCPATLSCPQTTSLPLSAPLGLV